MFIATCPTDKYTREMCTAFSRMTFGGAWWVDPCWTPHALRAAPSLPSAAGWDGEKIRWKNPLMGQDKGSLVRRKQRKTDLFSTSHQQVMSSYFQEVELQFM